jgi:hypothetical protein
MSKPVGARFPVCAWEGVSSEVLHEGWSIYEDFDGTEDWSKINKGYFKITIFISGE